MKKRWLKNVPFTNILFNLFFVLLWFLLYAHPVIVQWNIPYTGNDIPQGVVQVIAQHHEVGEVPDGVEINPTYKPSEAF